MDEIKLLSETTIKENKTTVKPLESNQKVIEVKENTAIENIKTDTRKPRIYKQFLRLIKQNKAITAITMGEILGVHRTTISKWLDTPQARETLSDNIDYHFNKITESKDWKAHAYMIDRATGKQDNQTNIQVNTLDGLTIIRR